MKLFEISKKIFIAYFIFSIITFSFLIKTSNATSMQLSTNTAQVKAGEEIIIKIKTDKNLETATFYLQYDNTKLEFVENSNKDVSIKDYPEEGILRVVYLDMKMEGTNEIDFKFKAKKKAVDVAEIQITNLTAQFIEDSTIYTDKNLEETVLNASINIEKNSISYILIYSFIVIGIVIIAILITKVIKTKNKKKNN